MSDDIVTRLRHWANGAAEQGVQEVVDGLNFAADEIEDLRFQLRGTHGELEGALSRERTLRDEQDDARIGADNLQAEIERLLAERDEARRELRIVQAERDELQRELNAARQTIFQMLTKLAACCRTPSSETTLGDGETFIPEAL